MAYQKSINSGKTAQRFIAVTPADEAELTYGQCSALFIGTGGTVKCIDEAGNETSFVNLSDASILPVQTSVVMSTGTTASNIVALY